MWDRVTVVQCIHVWGRALTEYFSDYEIAFMPKLFASTIITMYFSQHANCILLLIGQVLFFCIFIISMCNFIFVRITLCLSFCLCGVIKVFIISVP